MLGFIIMYCDLFGRLFMVFLSVVLLIFLIYIGLYYAILRKFKIFREIMG
jgi:hypothetical protein